MRGGRFGRSLGSPQRRSTVVGDPDDQIPAFALELRPDLAQPAKLSAQDGGRYRSLTQAVAGSTQIFGSLEEHRHRWDACLARRLSVPTAASGIKSQGVDYRCEPAANPGGDDPVEDVEGDLAGVKIMLTAPNQSP
jgi:hypothetical protein